MRGRREPAVLLGACLILLALSGLHPRDRLTWLLEVAPVLVALPILVLTASRFPLTPLLYRLLFLHSLILMVGGHYTYAEVPLGFWFRDALHLARNHFDRLGHLAQGFVPAVLVREVLIRRSPLARSRWLPVLTASVCLAISACYEFIEWWTALVNRQAAEAFLGTQGDPWDTQWDMFLCLVGAVLSLLVLSSRHDHELAALGADTGGRGAPPHSPLDERQR